MRKLKPNEIEVRVGTISKNYPKAMLLLYKDARCDMAILDETYGAENWQTEFVFLNKKSIITKTVDKTMEVLKEYEESVLFCRIGVYNEKIKEWVWKSSNGIESQGTGDDDPNNKKGEASDAFKRAGFMWGIGRELYEWKDLWIPYDKEKDKYEKYRVSNIAYNEQGEPKDLTIVNSKNKVMYELKNGYYTKTKSEVENETEETPDEPVQDMTDTIKQENRRIWQELINIAMMIYEDNDFTHEQAIPLAKQAPVDYIDGLKIPITKLELSKKKRPPYIKGNVVVVVDQDFIDDYKLNVSVDSSRPF